MCCGDIRSRRSNQEIRRSLLIALVLLVTRDSLRSKTTLARRIPTIAQAVIRSCRIR